MTHREFYLIIDTILEAEPGTIHGHEKLADLPTWDSLAVIGFMAAMDKHLNVQIPPNGISAAETVDDLRKLVSDRLSD
jgi:acyl carrier protein